MNGWLPVLPPPCNLWYLSQPSLHVLWSRTGVCYACVDVELNICIPGPRFSSPAISSLAFSGPAFSTPAFLVLHFPVLHFGLSNLSSLVPHFQRSLFSSNRQHLSYDGCLEVREIIRTVLCYCVLRLYTVISALRWAVLTVLWIGFCHTGPISLCIDLFVFLCLYSVFLFHTAYMSYYCNTVEGTWWDWSVIFRTLSSFSALTLLVGCFDP